MTNREGWLGSALVELADTRAADRGETAYLGHLIALLTELCIPAELGLMLADEDGNLAVAGGSTERARQIWMLEQRRGQGPCTHCYREGGSTRNVPLDATARLWPEFATASQAAGFRLVTTLPMRRHDEAIGAIGALCTGDTVVRQADAALGALLTEAATVGILQLRARRASEARAEQLQHALDSRVIIEQAKGVLAARLGIMPETAFDVLRSYARRHNRKLTDLAEAVVGGSLGARELARFK